ncbi:hypothetical protein QO012_003160 [Methylobacterium aerolatum]|uniref:DUF2946 domain-containing protein n=1 Tax=Methylobacterium aerolatum TaxID=418708 RepID=A0ABU0I4S8_9HYPH|nr:hypothetical protein [Methylobacterium aerolatum]MDQ0448649.1 hypothetical protein [Methylobacterium aerolatum]
MRTQRPRWTAVRVAIAVAALYALVLQAFLGGVLSAGLSGPDHRLCLGTVGTDDDGGPAKPSPAHANCECCTAAHVHPASHAPILAVSTVAWPRRGAVSLAWRPEVVAVPRAPPRFRAHARAPPIV